MYARFPLYGWNMNKNTLNNVKVEMKAIISHSSSVISHLDIPNGACILFEYKGKTLIKYIKTQPSVCPNRNKFGAS